MNLALPGLGSLAAGRKTGYLQMAIALLGLFLSMAWAVQFFFWYFANYSRLQSNPEDPLAGLLEVWRAARWPLLGLGIFALAWLWGLISGFLIVASAPESEKTER